jgi:hypothetical protein
LSDINVQARKTINDSNDTTLIDKISKCFTLSNLVSYKSHLDDLHKEYETVSKAESACVFIPFEPSTKENLQLSSKLFGVYNEIKHLKTKQEPFEPGDAPRIGFGHRKVYLL